MINLTCAVIVSVSIFLILEPYSLRKVFGVILLGNGVNLWIMANGRNLSTVPAFVKQGQTLSTNPLPQALILTAIVIGFGLLGFLFALLKKENVKQDKN